jgi:2-iminobutanoate/2-iminopropanoate deaminase
MKKIILSKIAPPPIGPYSQAVEANGFIFCSGQIPLDAAGNLVSGDAKFQTEQIMKNIEAVLTAAGVSFKNVIKTNIFLTDMKDFALVNEVYGRFFPENPPARSTIGVAALPKGAQVEIEVTALK